jgi:hypothetical protein
MSPNLPLPAQAGNPLEAKMGGGQKRRGKGRKKEGGEERLSFQDSDRRTVENNYHARL